ncbi:ABC transporter permease [Shewanella youngdeokensis]|uniref:Transport permease protein n=1 Tax=Shewanella youngdeokensis TaxID=2999068 RepID=A0ABZ0K1G6_9GAMM|nr:ABC transporter permease [Shewanella sp. DAU334]
MTQIIKRNNWAIWRDVIFALFVREIRTGFNDKFGIAWSVVNPVAFIFILSFVRGRMDGGETHTIPTFAFMALGLILIQFFLETVNSTSNAIKKNKALFAFRQVQPISSVLASALFVLLVKVFVCIVIMLIMYFLKMEIRIDDPLELIAVFILVWFTSVSVGIIFAISSCFVPETDKVKGLLLRPFFFISGVFFSLQDFPQMMWKYLDWNPMLHAIELARYSAYGSYGNAGVSFGYLTGVTICLSFLALASYQGYWKQAISR